MWTTLNGNIVPAMVLRVVNEQHMQFVVSKSIQKVELLCGDLKIVRFMRHLYITKEECELDGRPKFISKTW